MRIYVAHCQQFRDELGKPWDAKINGLDWDSTNCGMAAGVSLIVRATQGRHRIVTTDRDVLRGDPPPLSPRAVRHRSGDLDTKDPGTTVYDIAKAARAWDVNLEVLGGVRWARFAREIHGRAAVICTNFKQWPEAKECSPTFEGLHGVAWHFTCDDPRRAQVLLVDRTKIPPHPCTNGEHVLIGDPLCPNPRWLRIETVQRAMLAFSNNGRTVFAALAPPDPTPAGPVAPEPPAPVERTYTQAELDAAVQAARAEELRKAHTAYTTRDQAWRDALTTLATTGPASPAEQQPT